MYKHNLQYYYLHELFFAIAEKITHGICHANHETRTVLDLAALLQDKEDILSIERVCLHGIMINKGIRELGSKYFEDEKLFESVV
jgi:hypothetical protein